MAKGIDSPRKDRTRAPVSTEAETETPAKAEAVSASEKPDNTEVPLSSGKGGRYTMVNGKRVPRTD
jgi:hypothetical protein